MPTYGIALPVGVDPSTVYVDLETPEGGRIPVSMASFFGMLQRLAAAVNDDLDYVESRPGGSRMTMDEAYWCVEQLSAKFIAYMEEHYPEAAAAAAEIAQSMDAAVEKVEAETGEDMPPFLHVTTGNGSGGGNSVH